jgi:prepilin-type N-terminal cleavage/methylation domain-containing protein
LRRAFSLIEVLLAIFILGIGVISIAALFPAGIAQQRASVDDILGPTVANNAISLLRMKLKPEDFGSFEDFGVAPVDIPRYTIPGDFAWMRPAFSFSAGSGPVDERGAINIFSGGAWDATERSGGYPGSSPSLVGIPFNRALYGSAPRVIVTQNERYYPSATQNGTLDVAKPQYVWDCMFRRFQGKILVAIFVYRVTQPGGGGPLYITQPNPNNNRPPLPIWLDLTDPLVQANSCANGPWHPGGPDYDVFTNAPPDGANPIEQNSIVLGVPGGTPYDPDDQQQSWQEPRQWILDQNNNVHRIIGAWREDEDPANPMAVELVRAVPAMPGGVYYIGAGVNPAMVSDIWYLPVAVPDANGSLLTLTPVYVTVKEL